MIERYADKGITKIWSDEQKIAAWLKVELAVIQARYRLGLITSNIFSQIRDTLENIPVDLIWWKQREQETHHDLQAWVEERVRHLSIELRQYFHEGMTSYDTEETAFLLLLKESSERIFQCGALLKDALKKMALKYRYCPMMGITHGQHAEVQTFGKRCLTWLQEILVAETRVRSNLADLCESKISGAIGNYGGVTPEIELKALEILGFKPFYGATQILPRQLHAPLASSLTILVSVISKIGTDIRLGARSPRPIYQEPFGKSQTGSSRMPQKKNPISSEQLEGMERIALGCLVMIMQNTRTWEERAIEQSCVERVAWPDLFHVTVRSLTVCTKLMQGLQVYPDHMMQDIIDTHGTWAAGPAKEFLRERLAPLGVTTEEVYRIVQLAAFIVFQPKHSAKNIRENPPQSLDEAEEILCGNKISSPPKPSIEQIIANGQLSIISNLGVEQNQVDKWNSVLMDLFHNGNSCIYQYDSWRSVFSISDRLKDEEFLFKQIVGS
jgi:adenylosuccinate lyase